MPALPPRSEKKIKNFPSGVQSMGLLLLSSNVNCRAVKVFEPFGSKSATYTLICLAELANAICLPSAVADPLAGQNPDQFVSRLGSSIRAPVFRSIFRTQ